MKRGFTHSKGRAVTCDERKGSILVSFPSRVSSGDDTGCWTKQIVGWATTFFATHLHLHRMYNFHKDPDSTHVRRTIASLRTNLHKTCRRNGDLHLRNGAPVPFPRLTSKPSGVLSDFNDTVF